MAWCGRALLALLCVVLWPRVSLAYDQVGAVPTRVYSTDCALNPPASGPLGVVMAACEARLKRDLQNSGTFDGCPVTRSVNATLTQIRDYPSGSSSGTVLFAFFGSVTVTGAGQNACDAAHMTGGYDIGGPDQAAASASYSAQMGCEEGGHLIGSGATLACGCDVGYNVQSGKCKQYTCPPSGSYSAVTQPDQKVSNAGDGMCSGGCGYVPSSWKVGQDGQILATWPFKSSGSFCGGAPSPLNPAAESGELNSKNPAPVACGQNQCPGNVNGSAVCVPCQKSVEQGPSSSSSAPSSGSSSPGNGNTTSNTSTECNGVTCTTTTTTKDGSGNVTGQQQQTDKQESFCKENPQSSLCKQSSISGSCGGPIACDGDAVQCAIAADQIKRSCQWFDDPALDPMKQAGADAMNAGAQPPDHPAKNGTSTSMALSSLIDQGDALGAAGQCPADVTLSLAVPLVGPVPLNVALSQYCSPLRLLGNAGVAVALLVACIFVFKGNS